MGGIGVPELIIFVVLGGVVLAPFVVVGVLGRRRARRFGYESIAAYLRAIPHSDDERRDAADLALKGLVLCAIGVAFAPFVFVGLPPLFYGGRKLVYASMGLGLVDDAD